MLHCSFNFHNVIITFLQDLIDHQYTIASVSFRAILNQVMDTLGFDLHGWRAIFYKRLQVSSKALLLQGKSAEHSIV